MVPWTVVKYSAYAVGLFVLISAALSLIGTVLGIAVTLVAAVLSLLVVAAVAYATVKAILWLRGGSDDDSCPSDLDAAPDDRVDRLTEGYVDGELGEAQLERRLETELDGDGSDDIDRELERARSKCSKAAEAER